MSTKQRTNRLSKLKMTAGRLLAGMLAVTAMALPQAAQAQVHASGGSYTDEYVDANRIRWRVHVFTNIGSAQLEVIAGGDVEYLIVGGGGAGGETRGGGGGTAGRDGGSGIVVVRYQIQKGTILMFQ